MSIIGFGEIAELRLKCTWFVDTSIDAGVIVAFDPAVDMVLSLFALYRAISVILGRCVRSCTGYCNQQETRE